MTCDSKLPDRWAPNLTIKVSFSEAHLEQLPEAEGWVGSLAVMPDQKGVKLEDGCI